MQSISVSEFKAHCLRLFVEVDRTGRSLLITKKGKPIAVVSPPPPGAGKDSAFGAMAHRTDIKGDIVEPLDQEWEVLSD